MRTRALAALWLCAVLAPLGASAQERTDLDLQKRFRQVAEACHGSYNKAIPLPFAKDKVHADQIRKCIRDASLKSTPQALAYEMGEKAVTEKPGPSSALDTSQRLRMYFDEGRGKLIVSDMLKEPRFVGSSFLFYMTYLSAYTRLAPYLRTQDAPLGRGLCALVALGDSYPSDYAVLPDFGPECAVALALVHARPEIVSLAFPAASQADTSQRLTAALLDALAEICGVQAKDGLSGAVAILTGTQKLTAGTRFEVACVLPAASQGQQFLDYAMKNILHPGSCAQIALAVVPKASVTGDRAAALNDLGRALMKDFEAEVAARGLGAKAKAPEGTQKAPEATDLAADARFDTSCFLSVFRYLWRISPEVRAWEGKVRAACTNPDGNQRAKSKRELESELQDILQGKGPDAPLLAHFNAWLAHDPRQPAVQPHIELSFIEPPAPPAGEKAAPQVVTPVLELRWETERRGALEVILFRTSQNVDLPAPKEEEPEHVPVIPAETPKNPGQKLDKKEGKNPGEAKGEEGNSSAGDKGTIKGIFEAPVPKKLEKTAGIDPACEVHWRANSGAAEASFRPMDKCLEGIVTTTLWPSDQDPGPVVWAQILELKPGKPGPVRKLALSNGKTLVVGLAQDILKKVGGGGGKEGWAWRPAHELKVDDELLGEDRDDPVRIVSIKDENAPTDLVQPTMAVYMNLFVSGVLIKAKCLAGAGGLAPDTPVEVPAEGGQTQEKPIKNLEPEKAICGFDYSQATPHETAIASNHLRSSSCLVELQFKINGKDRTLRIAPQQRVRVLVDEPAAPLKTYAMADPALPAVVGKGHAQLAPGEKTRLLQVGMKLITSEGQQVTTTVLEGISAFGNGTEAKEGEVFEPELWNLGLIRAEGILCEALQQFDNAAGVQGDVVIVQPLAGTPPGVPANTWRETDTLPAIAISAMRAGGGDPFLTTTWPKMTWQEDRTQPMKYPCAHRAVEIDTPSGHIVCGNAQVFKVVPRGATQFEGLKPDQTEILAESLVGRTGDWDLLFLDRQKPDPKGTLARVPVKAASFRYSSKVMAFEELMGHGIACSEEIVDENHQKKVRKTDLYLANGFLAVGHFMEDLGGGGHSGGGGGGIFGEGEGIAPRPKEASPLISGLNDVSPPPPQGLIRFSDDERAIFRDHMVKLNEKFQANPWHEPNDRERFARFMGLFFSSDGTPERLRQYLQAHYLGTVEVEHSMVQAPWTQGAFMTYCKTRAALIDHGAPADLYQLALHYIFLITLFYESRSNDLGDALRDDFLCIAAQIALTQNNDYRGREEYYGKSEYLLPVALLWTRDVTYYLRDGKTGDRPEAVLVRPSGWDKELKAGLSRLGESQGICQEGKVNLENFWIQLHRYFHHQDPKEVSPSAYLIASPTQDPKRLFSNEGVAEGPYMGKTLHKILGIRQTRLDLPR